MHRRFAVGDFACCVGRHILWFRPIDYIPGALSRVVIALQIACDYCCFSSKLSFRLIEALYGVPSVNRPTHNRIFAWGSGSIRRVEWSTANRVSSRRLQPDIRLQTGDIHEVYPRC